MGGSLVSMGLANKWIPGLRACGLVLVPEGRISYGPSKGRMLRLAIPFYKNGKTFSHACFPPLLRHFVSHELNSKWSNLWNRAFHEIKHDFINELASKRDLISIL